MSPEMKSSRLRLARAPNAALFGLALVIAGAAREARAEPPRFSVTPKTSVSIAPYAQTRADPKRAITPRGALVGQVPFDPPLGVTPNFGIDSTPRWYRFSLHNATGERAHVYVDVGYSKLDEVALHHLERGEVVTERAGNALPFGQRPILHPTFLFRVPLEPHETRAFALEVRSESVHTVTVEASGHDAFIERNRTRSLLQGIFFGILIMLTLRHAFAFFTRRSRAELWYVAQSAGAGLYVASFLGSLYRFWPDAVAFNSLSPLYFLGVTIFASARLGVTSIAPRRFGRRLVDVTSYVVLAAAALAPVLAFETVSLLYFAGMLALGAVLLSTSLRRTLLGSKPALLYFVGWSPIFGAAWLLGLGAAGVLPLFHLGAELIGGALLWERIVVGAALELKVSEAMRSELRLREQALVAAEERRALETERQRGRRLESLGRLSGGIAHDFNNLLQAIGGYAHLLEHTERLSDTGRAHLDEM